MYIEHVEGLIKEKSISKGKNACDCVSSDVK